MKGHQASVGGEGAPPFHNPLSKVSAGGGRVPVKPNKPIASSSAHFVGELEGEVDLCGLYTAQNIIAVGSAVQDPSIPSRQGGQRL